MKNRINVYIFVLLSSVLGCYASQSHSAKFNNLEDFACQPSANETCFPFIIYSQPENFRSLSQIVYTIRMKNFAYKETTTYLNKSEYFEYQAGFAQIDDPSTFNYDSINYTAFTNYTSIVNNTAMKSALAKLDIGNFPTETKVNYVVIRIWCPQDVENLFKSFEFEVFSYEQPKDDSTFTMSIPENHYFYWLTPKTVEINQSFKFERKDFFYLELSPDNNTLNASITFYGITSDYSEISEIKTFQYKNLSDIKNVYYFKPDSKFSTITMNITVDNTTATLMYKGLLGYDMNQFLCMFKYTTQSWGANELLPLAWEMPLEELESYNDKTTTTIKFPPLKLKNEGKISKIVYIIRLFGYDFYYSDFFETGKTLPFNFIPNPFFVYTKEYTEIPKDKIKLGFFLDRGSYTFDIIAYVEYDNHVDFMKSPMYFFDVIYSEWLPLIVLASIVVGLLVLTGGYVTISKRIYKKKHLAQSGDLQAVERLNDQDNINEAVN